MLRLSITYRHYLVLLNKWRDARNRLLELAAKYPERLAGDARIEKAAGPRPPRRRAKQLDPAKFKKITKLLSTIVQEDATAYSLVLQGFLASMGLFWPGGVFKRDFAAPDRGRQFSRLSFDAFDYHFLQGKGWRSIARMLIPEEFEANAEEAATKVRKAAASYMRFFKSVSVGLFPPDVEDLTRIVRLLAGHEGLLELCERVLDRKMRDAWTNRPPGYRKRG